MIEDIDKNIIKFISKHHVMTLATVSENGFPRTANLFYAYDKANAQFIFTSSITTAHGSDMLKCGKVGANIVLETSNIGKIEGLQIEGFAQRVSNNDLLSAKILYIKAFPYAIVADLELWVLRAESFKMTDNKLGFGKKIIWTRS